MTAVIKLMTRPGCTLCEVMAADLATWAEGRFEYALEAVDISRDPTLERRYGARIPVLVHNGRELSTGRFDSSRAGRLLDID